MKGGRREGVGERACVLDHDPRPPCLRPPSQDRGAVGGCGGQRPHVNGNDRSALAPFPTSLPRLCSVAGGANEAPAQCVTLPPEQTRGGGGA